MKIKTVIEVMFWGDYGVKTTKCIMVSEEKRDVDEITKAYCTLRGLDGMDGLPFNMLRDTTEDFINYLMKEGFRELKTKEVIFSD